MLCYNVEVRKRGRGGGCQHPAATATVVQLEDFREDRMRRVCYYNACDLVATDGESAAVLLNYSTR